MKANKKRIFFWVKILVILYCAGGIALYYLQDKILFHPQTIGSDYSYKFKQLFRELNIPFSKEDTLNLIQFLPDKNANPKGVVLFFHGTNGNIENYAERATVFTKQNFEVWMVDYPSFGKSSGLFDEKKINSQAFEINKLALNRFKKENIIIYGQSIGASVAANLASSGNLASLILENPSYDVPNLLHHYTFVYPWSSMAAYKFSVYDALSYIDKRLQVTIITGNNGELFSSASAKKLKPMIDSNDVFINIRKNKANALYNEMEYQKLIGDLLQKN
jgi:pimeloyl-ACP methyl ester carboxylesterase